MDDIRKPVGEIAIPTQEKDGRTVLDLDKYAPYYLTSVYNALSSGASSLYLNTYGIGIMDWRVLSTIAIEPGIPASRLCELVALDKAAVSRSLHKLSDLGLMKFQASPTDPRRKIWTPSEKGYELHARMLDSAIERERLLIEGISPEDFDAFLRVMRQMWSNVRDMG